MSMNKPNNKKSVKAKPKQLTKISNQHNPKTKQFKVGNWEKMVVNPLVNQPARTPSLSPFTGAVRAFTRTISIQAAGAGDKFAFTLRPSLRDTFMVQRDVGLVLPAAPNWKLYNSAISATSEMINSRNALAGELTLTDISTGAKLGVYDSSYDPSAKVPYWAISGDATTSIDVTVNGRGMAFSVYWREAGVWSGPTTSPAMGGPLRVLPRVAFDGLLIGVLQPEGGTYGVGFAPSPAPGTLPTLLADQSYNLFDTPAVELSQVTSFRITAASFLASYSGNMFNNGGVIAAARTRADHYYNDTPYQALTKLQDHSYRGVLKDGAYCWWLPYSLEELEFKDPHSSDWQTELKCAGEFADASGNLALTLCLVVEFHSPLQIFEHNTGPPLTDAFVKLYHDLDTYPAATCNPAHEDILSKVMKNAKKGLKNAGNYLIGHPEAAMALLSMV